MKDEIEKLYELQKRNLIYSPWAQKTTLKERVNELHEEVDEALEELEKENWEKFKDEIGDVLWDCLGVIAKAEADGVLTIKGVLDHIHDKFTERKPYLLEERHVTREEETRVWHEVKEKQKNAGNRS